MRGPRTLITYLAALALIITVPILIVASIAVYNFAEAERSRHEALVDLANQDIAALIDRELLAQETMLRALAYTDPLDTGGIVHLEDEIRAISAQTGVHFVLRDLTGQELVNTSRPRGSPLPMTADREIVREVARTKQPYVSNLFRRSSDGRPTIEVAAPMMRGDDVIAILSSTVMPERLVELLRLSLPEGPVYATVLDRAGVIVARSVKPEEFIGKPFQALVNATQGAKGSISLLDNEGVPIFGHFRRSAVSGWVVAAAVEQAAIEAPLTRSLELLALAAAGLTALAIGGGWWVGRSLTRAHRSLVASAEALGEGRAIAPPKTYLHEANLVGDALAAASRSIASQAGEMQKANRELEQRVASRTQELALKTALLETTLDSMKQGLIVIDGDGRIPVCNPQARALLDLPDELIKDRPTVGELIALQERRGDLDGLSPEKMRLLKPEAGDDITVFERQRRNGTVLEVHTVPIPGGRGFVRTYTDITRRRRHERELEDARREAEEANRAKSDFLATMSHEMRTPLNAIIGYSELLLHNSDLNDDARRRADRIQNASSALLSLVDEVLDLGKIEAGIFDMRAEPFSLPKLVNDAVSIVRSAAIEKNLELTVSLDTSLGDFFVGDQNRIRQVLLNLLKNAIKFTPSGDVRLTVVQRTGENGCHILRFAVADTGIGIARDAQGGLFKRFHQIDPSLDRRFGGAGLGLAISKQLVERMGGSIGLESDLGQGSIFWFELALVKATKLVAARHIERRRRAARILVAEDVMINRELARELLETAGHTVESVSNGVEAVAAVKSGVYDLVLMDVSMPEMDGLTATRLIRNAGPAAATPIVACTAHVLPAQVTAFRDAGVDAYLRKPLQRSELFATIDRILARGPDQTDNRPQASSTRPEQEGVWNIVSLLGPERVIAALDTLTQELATLTLADPSDVVGCRSLAERAHAVIAIASMLELTDLAESCRDLEDACRETVGVAQALERLGPAVHGALAKGDRLRSDLERYSA